MSDSSEIQHSKHYFVPPIQHNRNLWNIFFQYGLKKKVKEVEPNPSEDPDMAGRLGRKRKTPAELAAEANAEEDQEESKFSSLCCCFSFV